MIRSFPKRGLLQSGLAYFCQTWDLDSATKAWLAYLHQDVQQELILDPRQQGG